MAGDVLLDTNIVIALWDRDPTVTAGIASADSVRVPVVVLGELFYGALHFGRPEANVARVQAFASACDVTAPDLETSLSYGHIKHGLRVAGKPLPENDIWIAALALQHNWALVTRDQHFSAIAGLAVIAW